MAAPTLTPYYVHAIDYKKGHPSPYAVDKVAKLSSTVTGNAYSGRCAHLNSSGEFELGAKGKQMPMFLIPGSGDPDVRNTDYDAGIDTYAVAPANNMSALVAVGATELETTEFDQTKTYAYNDHLHSPTEDQVTGADKAAAGKLFKTKNWPGGSDAALVLYTDSVCGVVSKPAYSNSLRQTVLTFWPVYLPSASA